MKLLTALLLLTIRLGGFVHDGAAEIIFPQAIRFSVNLTIPASRIAAANLTIMPEGQQPITVNVDMRRASLVYDEPQARLFYIWRIPVADPPTLFKNISYQWSFVTTDGDSGTLSDIFTFADPRVDWVRSLDPHFNITVPRSQTSLVDALRQVHALLEKNSGHTLDENLILYPMQPGCTPAADDPTKQIARGQDGTTVDCDTGIQDALFAGYRLLVQPPALTAEDFVVGTLVRDAYAPLWGSKEVPAWFVDGLAQFYAPSLKSSLLPPVQQGARANSLFTLDQMAAAQSMALWRAQAYGMDLYIADRIGVQSLFDLARVDADSLAAAYERALGEPITSLIPAWQQWIFTRAALSDYGITPYQPSTPTPSATPTSSDTPTPSPTSTLTPSVTPTFTFTPRGFRSSYVAPPTLTPSTTFTPLPATVTPRPPGSLLTITPTPTALQEAVAQPGVTAGAATFLVLLLALLLFLFIRLGNRQ